MPIAVTCACGKQYVLKDEFAGRIGQQRKEPAFAAYERRLGDGLHSRLHGIGRLAEDAGDRG